MSLLDLDSFYALTNSYAGPSKQLASNGDTLVMEPSSTANSHQWYFTTAPANSLYRLHTRQTGDSKSLDVVNNNDVRSTGLQFASTGQYTGQYWRVEQSADGTYSLSNNFTGVGMHLDTHSDTLGPFLSDGDYSGQHWTFSKVSSPPSSTLPPSDNTVTSPIPTTVVSPNGNSLPSSSPDSGSDVPTTPSQSAATVTLAPSLGTSQRLSLWQSSHVLSTRAIVGIIIGGVVAFTA